MIYSHSKSEANPIGNLTSPIVTGGCLIGLKCKEGVIIAADTLLAYGGLLKYNDICRFEKINDNVVICATGQYSDFQEITKKLNQLTHESYLYDDNVNYSPQDYSNYLRKICYEKRNKQNPFYNNTLLAGFDKGEGYLCNVDLYGTLIKQDYVVGGFAKHFGLAKIANEWNPNKTAAECKQILKTCFMVIYERVCHSIDQIQFTVVSKDGIQIEAPVHIESRWDFKEFRERKNEKLWQ